MTTHLGLGLTETSMLGDIISRQRKSDQPERIITFIERFVELDSSLMLIYYPERRPKLLFDGLKNAQRRNSVTAYLESAYLLDPFYQAALRRTEPGLLRFGDVCDQDTTFEAYFRDYYRQSAVIDEVNFVVPLSSESIAALSIERASHGSAFSDQEIERLELLSPLISGIVTSCFAAELDPQQSKDLVHDGLEKRLSQFRSELLTLREREIVSRLLKAEQVSQIAATLGISIETVRVHRRNIYAKLSISSLAELFSLAFDWVTDKAR